MNISPPKESSIAYPQIKVFIPYTQIQPATLISLIGYNYTPVKIEDNKYSDYFKKRWEEGEAFINIEHDIVVWPGALESLWECPEPLCAYNYHLPNHRLEINPRLPIGCVKISKEFIAENKDIWDKPVEWNALDQNFMQSAHQHFPGVVNASPALLGLTGGIN